MRGKGLRRLIVCCDGTWNFPEQSDQNVESPTNVVKVARGVKPLTATGVSQVVFYHNGVGVTSDRFFGGISGAGLSQIIMELYGFLVDNYTKGDEIFLFGFSRGAYAARSLAGLIRNCGILKKSNADQIGEAYALYRNSDEDCRPGGPVAASFAKKYSREVRLKFVGVWDTVGSLGIPDPALHFLVADSVNFHDTTLSGVVESAYHALALDERRRAFAPCLWHKQADAPPGQILQQVWFSGVHSNVGGGYADAGLSDVALDWMIGRAEYHSLEFDHDYLSEVVKPNPEAMMRNSKTGLYKIFPDAFRALHSPETCEFLHPTVLGRRERLSAYQPPQLTNYPGSPEIDLLELLRA